MYIKNDWREVSDNARPYLDAMEEIKTMNGVFGSDDGVGIVLYFLGNSHRWTGPVAREVKSYLKQITTDYYKDNPLKIK